MNTSHNTDASEIITSAEFKPTQPWLNLMAFVQNVCPDGEIRLKFAAGSPTEITELLPRLRLDKEPLPSIVFLSQIKHA